MKIVLIVFFCYSFSLLTETESKTTQGSRRDEILENELKMSIGGNIVLNDEESLVNKVLMQWKVQELDQGFNNSHKFMFARNYFEYMDDIKKSKVYDFIKEMPKGAALHVHANALLSADEYLNITYKDYLYVCFGKKLQFKFANFLPKDDCETEWRLMSDVRKSVADVTQFDLELRNNFTLVGVHDTNDTNVMWERFSYIFDVIYPLWAYRPVWEEYFYEILKKFRDDKVMYMEVRSSFPDLYELDGTSHNELFFINTTKIVTDRFVDNYPDFLGAKMICSFNRHVQPRRVGELLQLTKESKIMFPEFVVGFDLVGHEDVGGSLLKFLPELEAAKADLDYFFHAGETNRYGTSTDQNLIDAVLLGTKRIGHAYALLKHPLVLEEVTRKQIGLEVSLVSNNVLGYVVDMRNHPLASFIAQGLPVVVSSDDPGLWGAAPLATDFYVAFMGVASRAHDLRLLKQLALNSIEYSSLKSDKKAIAFTMFDSQWNRFIHGFVKQHADLLPSESSQNTSTTPSNSALTINSDYYANTAFTLCLNMQLLIGLQLWMTVILLR